MKKKLFECVDGNQFKLAEKKITDPTKEEMLQFLAQQYGGEEGFQDEAEVAMYWFAYFYHGGQASNLYSVLSTSPFSPGPIARGPEPGSFEEIMYQALEDEFGSGQQSEEPVQEDGATGGGTGMGMSVTGAVQGYSTPKAFSKKKLGEAEMVDPTTGEIAPGPRDREEEWGLQPEKSAERKPVPVKINKAAVQSALSAISKMKNHEWRPLLDRARKAYQLFPDDGNDPRKLQLAMALQYMDENPPNVMKEVQKSPFYDRLDQALTAVEEYIVQNQIQVDPNEHSQDPTDPGLTQTDPYRIREPYLYGGINYGQQKEAHYKLAAFKGKPTKKYLHVTIRRTEQGRYEMNCYVL